MGVELGLSQPEKKTLWVSENRVLESLFGPEREELTEGWRRLHNEELHNVHVSLNIIRLIDSLRMR
jgi:hypothetical protein